MHRRGKDRVKQDIRKATLKQLATLIGVAGTGIARAKFSFDEMEVFLDNKLRVSGSIANALHAELKALARHAILVQECDLWMKLDVAVEIDNLNAPDLPADFTEMAIIPAQLTNEQLFVLCEKHFPSWKYYGNLDESSAQQKRPSGTYVVGYRGGIDSDIEHRNKSYDNAINEGLIFLNPKERLIAELRYFMRTGRHLDENGWTIMSSLTQNGDAFDADWNLSSGRFRMGESDRSYPCPWGGPRQAIFA